MNTKNIKDGQIFPTKTKLIEAMGEKAKKDSSKDAQWKDVECLVAWEYTGKLNKNTGKVSNELRITKIYDVPLVKEDKRKQKKGVFKDSFILLIPRIETGLYKTSEMFEFIFGNTFDAEYIEPWKHTRKDEKNIKALKGYIRDKFNSNLMSNLEQFDKNNEGFTYAKVYHLWNGEFFKNGIDLCEFEFKPFKEECIEKFKEEHNLDNIYRGNKEFDEYFSSCLNEKFHYENYCVMYDITNNLEEKTVSGSRIRDARTNLIFHLMESVAKEMNKYNWQMKDKMHRVINKPYYPYRNDVRVLGMFNTITECWRFAREHFDITTESVLEELKKSEEKVARDYRNKQQELEEQNESRAEARERNNWSSSSSQSNYDSEFPFALDEDEPFTVDEPVVIELQTSKTISHYDWENENPFE